MTEAQGYFELGLYEDSLEAIEELPPAQRTSIPIIQLQASIYMKLEAWHLLGAMGSALVRFKPEEAQHWMWFAYATRRSDSIESAEKILRDALNHHPDDGTVHYNLACYTAQIGRLDEARQFLTEAIRLDPDYQKMALDDPDLEPLW